MRSSRPCQLLAILTALLLSVPSAFAFSFPLSEESVREAYFLGQRRDESMALFLARYKRTLRPPETGPYISSVELLTPFAELVRLSSQRSNYSAQQAAKEHRRDDETVAITIEIQLTNSYGAIIAQPTSSRSGSPMGYKLRYSTFWKDFDVQVLVDDKGVEPTLFTGEPNYRCVYDGGCVLTGATLRLELPAKLFDSDSATVHVTPPEGPEVFADFNLSSAAGMPFEAQGKPPQPKFLLFQSLPQNVAGIPICMPRSRFEKAAPKATYPDLTTGIA